MKKRTTTIVMGMLLFTAAAVGWADEDVRFRGGSYDGWDHSVMATSARLDGALVSFASSTDQTFAWSEANPDLAMLTIGITGPVGTITNGGTMRVTVPSAWACRFDTGVNVTYGGNADGKVDPATFSNGGRTLNIPVTTDFTDGDTLTISGLKLVDLALCRAGVQRLELDFTGDGVLDVYDQQVLTLTVDWPGGSYDGWDSNAMAQSQEINPTPRGTMILIR